MSDGLINANSPLLSFSVLSLLATILAAPAYVGFLAEYARMKRNWDSM